MPAWSRHHTLQQTLFLLNTLSRPGGSFIFAFAGPPASDLLLSEKQSQRQQHSQLRGAIAGAAAKGKTSASAPSRTATVADEEVQELERHAASSRFLFLQKRQGQQGGISRRARKVKVLSTSTSSALISGASPKQSTEVVSDRNKIKSAEDHIIIASESDETKERSPRSSRTPAATLFLDTGAAAEAHGKNYKTKTARSTAPGRPAAQNEELQVLLDRAHQAHDVVLLDYSAAGGATAGGLETDPVKPRKIFAEQALREVDDREFVRLDNIKDLHADVSNIGSYDSHETTARSAWSLHDVDTKAHDFFPSVSSGAQQAHEHDGELVSGSLPASDESQTMASSSSGGRGEDSGGPDPVPDVPQVYKTFENKPPTLRPFGGERSFSAGTVPARSPKVRAVLAPPAHPAPHYLPPTNPRDAAEPPPSIPNENYSRPFFQLWQQQTKPVNPFQNVNVCTTDGFYKKFVKTNGEVVTRCSSEELQIPEIESFDEYRLWEHQNFAEASETSPPLSAELDFFSLAAFASPAGIRNAAETSSPHERTLYSLSAKAKLEQSGILTSLTNGQDVLRDVVVLGDLVEKGAKTAIPIESYFENIVGNFPNYLHPADGSVAAGTGTRRNAAAGGAVAPYKVNLYPVLGGNEIGHAEHQPLWDHGEAYKFGYSGNVMAWLQWMRALVFQAQSAAKPEDLVSDRFPRAVSQGGTVDAFDKFSAAYAFSVMRNHRVRFFALHEHPAFDGVCEELFRAKKDCLRLGSEYTENRSEIEQACGKVEDASSSLMSKYKDTCRDDYMAGGYQQCGESSTDSLDKIAAQDEETSTGTGSSLSWKDCHSLNQLASSATWLKQQLAETCSTGEEGGHESKPRYAVVFLHNLLRYRSWDWRADGSANSKSGLFQLWDALEGSCVVLVVTAHEDEESEKMDKDAAGGAARAGINGGELQDTNLGGGTESDINQDRQDDLQKQIVEDEAALLPFNTWGNQIRLARTGRIALGEWVRLDIALEDVVKEQRPCTMRWQNYFAATEGPGHINSTSKITEIPLVGCEWSGRTAVTTAHPYIVKTKSRTTTTFSGGSTPPGVAEEINAPGGGPGQGGGTHPLPDYTNVDLFFDQFPASDKNSTGQAGSGRINERTSEQELGRSSATTNGTTEDTNEDDADDSESCLGALTWKAMGIVIGSSVLALVTILLCVWAFCCLGSEDVEGEGEQEGPNKAGKRYGNRAKKKLEKSKSKGGTGPLEQDGLGAEDLMNQNAEHSTLNTMVGSSYPSMQPDMFFAGFTPAPPMPGTLALARAGALPNKVGDEVETKPANKVPLAATPMAAPQPPGAAALEQRRARLAGVVAKLKPEPSSGDATLFEGVEDET